MHGFSALESINEKIAEELASQEEDENDIDDDYAQKEENYDGSTEARKNSDRKIQSKENLENESHV